MESRTQDTPPATQEIAKFRALLREFSNAHAEFARRVNAYNDQFGPTLAERVAKQVKSLFNFASAEETPLVKETTHQLDSWFTATVADDLTRCAEVTESFLRALTEEETARAKAIASIPTMQQRLKAEFTTAIKAHTAATSQAKKDGDGLLAEMENLKHIYQSLEEYRQQLVALREEATPKITELTEKTGAFQTKHPVDPSLTQLIERTPEKKPNFASDLQTLAELKADIEEAKESTPTALQQRMHQLADAKTQLADVPEKMKTLTTEYAATPFAALENSLKALQAEIDHESSVDLKALRERLIQLTDTLDRGQEIGAAFDESLQKLKQQEETLASRIKVIEDTRGRIPAPIIEDEFSNIIKLTAAITSLYNDYNTQKNRLTDLIVRSNLKTHKDMELLLDYFKTIEPQQRFTDLEKCMELLTSKEATLGELSEKLILIKKDSTALLQEINQYDGSSRAMQLMKSFVKHKQINRTPREIQALLTTHAKSIAEKTKQVEDVWLPKKKTWLQEIEEELRSAYPFPSLLESLCTACVAIQTSFAKLEKQAAITSAKSSSEQYKQLVSQYNALLPLVKNILAQASALSRNDQLKKLLRAVAAEVSDKAKWCVEHCRSAFQTGFAALQADSDVTEVMARPEQLASIRLSGEPADVAIADLLTKLSESEASMVGLERTREYLVSVVSSRDKLNEAASLRRLELISTISEFKRLYKEFNQATAERATYVAYGVACREKLTPDLQLLKELLPVVANIGALHRGYVAAKDFHHGFSERLTVDCESMLATEQEKQLVAKEQHALLTKIKSSVLSQLRLVDLDDAISCAKVRCNVDNLLGLNSELWRQLLPKQRPHPRQKERMQKSANNAEALYPELVKLIACFDTLYPQTGKFADPDGSDSESDETLKLIPSSFEDLYFQLKQQYPAYGKPKIIRMIDSLTVIRNAVMDFINAYDTDARKSLQNNDKLKTRIAKILKKLPEEIGEHLKSTYETKNQTTQKIIALQNKKQRDITEKRLLIAAHITNIRIPGSTLPLRRISTTYPPIVGRSEPITSADERNSIKTLRTQSEKNVLLTFNLEQFTSTLENPELDETKSGSLLADATAKLEADKRNIKISLDEIKRINAARIYYASTEPLKDKNAEKIRKLKEEKKELQAAHTEQSKALDDYIQQIAHSSSALQTFCAQIAALPDELSLAPNLTKELLTFIEPAPIKLSKLTTALRKKTWLIKCDTLAATPQQSTIGAPFLALQAFSLKFDPNTAYQFLPDELSTLFKSSMTQIAAIASDNFVLGIQENLTGLGVQYLAQQEPKLWACYHAEVKKIDDLYAWLLDINKQIKRLEVIPDEEAASYKQQVTQLKDWVKTYAEPASAAQQDLVAQRGRIEELDQALAKLAAEQRELEEKQQLQAECAELQQKMDMLKSTLERQLADTEKQIQDMQTRTSRLEQRKAAKQTFRTRKLDDELFKRFCHYALNTHSETKEKIGALREHASKHDDREKSQAIAEFIAKLSTFNTPSALLTFIQNIVDKKELAYSGGVISLLKSDKKNPTKTCELIQDFHHALLTIMPGWKTFIPAGDLIEDFSSKEKLLSNFSFLRDPKAAPAQPTFFLFHHHYKQLFEKLEDTGSKHYTPDFKKGMQDALQLVLEDNTDDIAKLRSLHQLVKNKLETVSALPKSTPRTPSKWVPMLSSIGITKGQGSSLRRALEEYTSVLDQALAPYPAVQPN